MFVNVTEFLSVFWEIHEKKWSVQGFPLVVGDTRDPSPPLTEKCFLLSWKLSMCEYFLEVQWIEEMKGSILSPFTGGRGHSFKRYLTSKILSPPH